jgi:hypothetical protein
MNLESKKNLLKIINIHFQARLHRKHLLVGGGSMHDIEMCTNPSNTLYQLTLTRTFFLSIGLTTSPTYDPCSCNNCNSSRNIRTG